MIIRLTSADLANFAIGEISELYYGITRNGHYLECDDATRTRLNEAVEQYGSRMQKRLIKNNHQGHLTAEIRKYLTTIIGNQYTYDELMTIVCKPSCLLIENLAYESDVYRSIIGTYVGDPVYRNIFKKLDDAQNRGWLTFLHAGGFGMFAPLLNYYDQRDYKHVADKKIAVLMDRDTEDGSRFPPSRGQLFKLLSGKQYAHLSNNDVYTLSQTDYVWHIWHKRAIENYFPAEQFDNLGFQSNTAPTVPADWSYKDLGKIKRYDKKHLFNVSVGMSRTTYEANCSQFIVGGESMSEMQLFLLKLVKLI